jgi:predicted aconitase with swiveling domain
VSSKTFKCKVLVGGNASGEALICRQAFAFDRAVDPRTGIVVDIRSEMAGANIRGKVLFYGQSKGSTAGSSWLVEAIRLGKGPAAVVTENPDLAAVVGSCVAGILYGRTIPVLSGIDARVFSKANAKAKAGSGLLARVKGDSAEVILAG